MYGGYTGGQDAGGLQSTVSDGSFGQHLQAVQGAADEREKSSVGTCSNSNVLWFIEIP